MFGVAIMNVLIYYDLYSQNAINASKHIYLLSESGYAILANIMEDCCGLSKVVLQDYFDGNTYVLESKRYEIYFRDTVKELFKNIYNIKYQYYIDGYRIDVYIPDIKLAIEYDEHQHKYHKEEDLIRQQYIKNKLGCDFIRIDKDERMSVGMNRIIKHILINNSYVNIAVDNIKSNKYETKNDKTNNHRQQNKKNMRSIKNSSRNGLPKNLNDMINTYARRNNTPQSDVRTMIYNKIEDKYGFSVSQRVKNRRKIINKERMAKGKKPYAVSSLKQKYNGMNVIFENGYEKEVMEILAGMQ